ncbi:MAG: Sec23/Sec24 family protein [Aureobasidium pullulans]
MTQDQDDHHDSSSSSSEDDEDVIRPKHSASQRDPQSKTEIPDKGKGKGEEKESRAKRKQLNNATFQNGINGEFNIFSHPRGTVRRRPKSITSSNTRTIG